MVLYISRTSLASYTFSGTKVTIPKGQKVFLPVYAIQRDKDIYPKPDVFDPERFMNGNAENRHPMHFLPFGDGPRNCIGKINKINNDKIKSNFVSSFQVRDLLRSSRQWL